MGEENKVTLHGMWASTYSKRVEIALRVKGIPYDYVEEDLSNKSQLLLQGNPVHKKVPVLAHNGKHLAESYIILEYIDETWQNSPKLLPQDPYDRAMVRFWASFIYHQLYESIGQVFTTNDEAQQRAANELHEKLNVLENGMKELYPEGIPFLKGEDIGLLDILVCATLGPYKIQEEVLGFKILNKERSPLLASWVDALNERPVFNELRPPHDKLKGFLQFIRENVSKGSN